MSQITITLGGYQPPDCVHNRAAEILGKELADRLGDAIVYEMDGNMTASTGIKAMDLLELVESGKLTMCYFSGSYLADRVPEIGIFDLPFVVNSREQAYAALDGEMGALLKEQFLDKTGFRILAFWDNGFRHFSNAVRSIRTPEDCGGMKMRSMNSALHQQFFRLLGFEPAFVDVRDLVNAVHSREIDAQENPLTNTYRFGMHETHKHITLSGHFFGVSLLLVNNDMYESWPDAVKTALQEAVSIATEAQRGFAADEDVEMLAALAETETEVVDLSPEERAKFKAAVEPLLAEQREVLGNRVFALVE